MSFSEKSPKEISSSRTFALPSQRSRCFAPFLTTMLDPFRKEILLFPIWTCSPSSRATQNSFLCSCDCRLVRAPGLMVSIFTVERSFKVYWSNDPHGLIACFNPITRVRNDFQLEILMGIIFLEDYIYLNRVYSTSFCPFYLLADAQRIGCEN